MNNRKGNIEISILVITIILVVIILFSIFLLYIQINSSIFNLKSDLFYIAHNAYLSINSKELAYSNYIIDEVILKDRIIELLKLNYPELKIFINQIKYDYINKSVDININVLVEPIILKYLIGNINLNIKDNIKLKLMEVK